jgi:hypothetical protein
VPCVERKRLLHRFILNRKGQMRKLRMEDLAVESFQTGEGAYTGTVVGANDPTDQTWVNSCCGTCNVLRR